MAKDLPYAPWCKTKWQQDNHYITMKQNQGGYPNNYIPYYYTHATHSCGHKSIGPLIGNHSIRVHNHVGNVPRRCVTYRVNMVLR